MCAQNVLRGGTIPEEYAVKNTRIQTLIPFHTHPALPPMSSPAAFCTGMMPLSLWLPPALHKNSSWERFDTQTHSHPSHVSGMPICFCSGFSSDKTGWRALAQRTSLRVALDNPLDWRLINLKRNRKWKERSLEAQIWAMTFAVKPKPSQQLQNFKLVAGAIN